MTTGRTSWICAILVTAMMIVPAMPALSGEPRAAPVNIVRHISTLGDGSAEKTVSFKQAGKDTSLYLTVPNGAKILSAKMNITGEPSTSGGKDYPENLTLDAGDDGTVEWAFKGKGYGRFGEQNLISNGTNSSNIYKARFYEAGKDDTTMISLPKGAKVIRATLKLEGSHGVGPDTINTVTQMQSWAQNWQVTSGTCVFLDEVNQQNLYDMMQFDLSSIPDTAFVSNAILWWGRNGNNPFDGWGYSFNDQLGAYRLEKSWTVPNAGLVTESQAESYNAIVKINVFYDWNITKMMGSWVDGGHANYGLCVHRKNGPDNNKWDYSLAPYITLQYGTPADVNLTIKDTAIVLFFRSGIFDTLAVTPDFSAVLNDYLSNNDASMADDYGNEFLDVPLSLASMQAGRVNMYDLDVAYRLCATVDANPGSGNLAAALEALVSPAADGGNTKIALALFSNHTGKVKVSDIMIDYKPPDHPATIESWTPEDFVVEMNENQTVSFNITASDLYDYPLNVSWYVNNQFYLKNWYNMSWYANYDANGTYNVTVKVNNLIRDTAHSWSLIVKNVNRKPIIDSFNPAKTYEMDEASSAIFDVAARDPDGDELSYTWNLDGKKTGTNDASYEFKTSYFSAGKHDIKVTATDTGGLSVSMSWSVTVNDVNAEPTITDSTPAGTELTMNENEVRRFTVADQAIDGDKLTEVWSLDGANTGVTGKSYNYSADYSSSGRHVVEVQVTDGKLTVSKAWNVNVNDVNRPPAAVIASPEAGKGFLTWDEIVLDGTLSSDPDEDALNLTWSDGKKALGSGATLTVHLGKGIHQIMLTANDGKKNGLVTAQVEITVRYIEFSGELTPSIDKPVEGKNVKLSVQLTNKGDGSFGELPVAFRVDGLDIASQDIQDIMPDSGHTLEFQWKAIRGDHKLEVSVLNQNFSKTITVARKPEVKQDNSWLWPVMGAIVVVVAVAAGAMAFARRKRPAAAPPAAQMVAQPPPAPAAPPAYLPTVERMAGPPPPAQSPPLTATPPAQPPPLTATPPAPSPPPSAAPPVPSPPPTAAPSETVPLNEEANARETIKNMEEMLLQAEKLGIDTSKARQTFKIAQSFLDMGKYQKAIQYCKMAEGYIE